MELLLYVLRMLLGLPSQAPDELARVVVHSDGRTSCLREGQGTEYSPPGATDGDNVCQRFLALPTDEVSATRRAWSFYSAAGFRPRRR